MIVFVTFLVLFSRQWEHCNSAYQGKATSRRLKTIISNLNVELIKDAIRKIDTVLHFRDHFYNSLAFQVGLSYSRMIRLFKTMQYIYRDSYRKYHAQRAAQVHSSVIANTRDLLRLQRKAMELDGIIQMIEEWEIKTDSKQGIHKRMSVLRRNIGHGTDEVNPKWLDRIGTATLDDLVDKRRNNKLNKVRRINITTRSTKKVNGKWRPNVAARI